jgi:hypothetical protein
VDEVRNEVSGWRVGQPDALSSITTRDRGDGLAVSLELVGPARPEGEQPGEAELRAAVEPEWRSSPELTALLEARERVGALRAAVALADRELLDARAGHERALQGPAAPELARDIADAAGKVEAAERSLAQARRSLEALQGEEDRAERAAQRALRAVIEAAATRTAEQVKGELGVAFQAFLAAAGGTLDALVRVRAAYRWLYSIADVLVAALGDLMPQAAERPAAEQGPRVAPPEGAPSMRRVSRAEAIAQGTATPPEAPAAAVRPSAETVYVAKGLEQTIQEGYMDANGVFQRGQPPAPPRPPAVMEVATTPAGAAYLAEHGGTPPFFGSVKDGLEMAEALKAQRGETTSETQ